MTTTAEKIKELENRIGGLKSDLDLLKLQIKENTKPADPKPLECWVNVYEGERLPACVHMDEQRARMLRLFRKVTCLLDSQPR